MDGHWTIPVDPRFISSRRLTPAGPSKVISLETVESGFEHHVVRRDDGHEIIFFFDSRDFQIDTTGLELAEYRPDAWKKPSPRAQPVSRHAMYDVSAPRLMMHVGFFGSVGVQLVLDLIRTL